MTLRVYVAASSAEWMRARRVMDALRAGGAEITADWTVPVEQAHAAGRPDAGLDDATAAAFARGDLDGIVRADVFLLLRGAPSFGATYEAAFAAGFHEAACDGGVRLVVVGDTSPIFLRRWERHATDEEAVRAIVGRP